MTDKHDEDTAGKSGQPGTEPSTKPGAGDAGGEKQKGDGEGGDAKA